MSSANPGLIGDDKVKRALKSGVSLWALNFAISLVATLVMIFLVVLFGLSYKQGERTTSFNVLAGLVSLATMFVVAGWLLPPLCRWVQNKRKREPPVVTPAVTPALTPAATPAVTPAVTPSIVPPLPEVEV